MEAQTSDTSSESTSPGTEPEGGAGAGPGMQFFEFVPKTNSSAATRRSQQPLAARALPAQSSGSMVWPSQPGPSFGSSGEESQANTRTQTLTPPLATSAVTRRSSRAAESSSSPWRMGVTVPSGAIGRSAWLSSAP